MRKPTIRELLKLNLETYNYSPDGALPQLAERVEAVLRIRDYANDYDEVWKDGYNAAIREVRRALEDE